MNDTRAVLITGAAGYWGRRLARRLLLEPGLRVVGLDKEVVPEPYAGISYLQSDLRHRDLPDLLAQADVDAICHLSFQPAPVHSEASFERNVMGTINLFGACAQAGVRKIVVKSSTAVYGARHDNPAFLRETHPLRGSRHTGTVRHQMEIEHFCRKFPHTDPEARLTVLRFAHIVGPTADTRMTHFLREAGAPVLLGFDPMMQFIHEDDVVEALAHALLTDVTGVFNVAAPPPLPLTRALALAQKIPVVLPHPLAYWGATVAPDVARYAPLPLDDLRYRCVADTERMSEVLGFMPAITADEALRMFDAGSGHRLLAAIVEQAVNQGEQLRRWLEKQRSGGQPQEAPQEAPQETPREDAE